MVAGLLLFTEPLPIDCYRHSSGSLDPDCQVSPLELLAERDRGIRSADIDDYCLCHTLSHVQRLDRRPGVAVRHVSSMIDRTKPTRRGVGFVVFQV